MVFLCLHVCDPFCGSREVLNEIVTFSSELWRVSLCSVTGKKLMAKCRGLLQENQELGKQISQGRVTQLEAEVTLHKKYNQEIKNAQEGTYCIL